ncbi:MAG TPA: metallopeptidase family protein [Candidatus Saccharimonadales bacterium]|jgi:predicted Zn-dependent protease with MMP-like domain|nr:metallopeptidase family protein [Candidatus Saccharimonadales bacterium]
MHEVTDEQFSEMIATAMTRLPSTHQAAVKNVAIVYEDDPSPEQREELKLQCHETLFGLYQGVPLSRRQGMTSYPPDKITIFKNPMLRQARDMADLQKQVTHTVWHEVAHYFGLDHDQIHQLEAKR